MYESSQPTGTTRSNIMSLYCVENVSFSPPFRCLFTILSLLLFIYNKTYDIGCWLVDQQPGTHGSHICETLRGLHPRPHRLRRFHFVCRTHFIGQPKRPLFTRYPISQQQPADAQNGLNFSCHNSRCQCAFTH